MRRTILMVSAMLAISIMDGCNSDLAGSAGKGPLKTIWLDEMDLSKVPSGGDAAQANKSVGGNPITMNAQQYERGLGVNAPSDFHIDLYGRAIRLTAVVGIDDEVKSDQQQQQQRRRRRGASVDFKIVGDGKLLWESGVRRPNNEPNEVDVDLTGIIKLRLIVKEVDSNYNDHADWAMAKIEYTGRKAPAAVDPPVVEKYILTPKPGPKPRITGPKVFGVRPGNPFLFTVTATGERPMSFGVKGLPAGLSINSWTGRITGSLKERGEHKVTVFAKNTRGTAEREFRIVVGDTIALTPPMGWNSWNCWACAVDDEKVRATAKAMVDIGLIHHGWSYINIDDCWMRTENPRGGGNDPNLGPPVRNENGDLIPNTKFPDMKALTDYIHGLGLKAGIYIGPGPTTCQRYVASWEHELQDAKKFAEWGFDYLKYDWCGYSSVSGRETLEDLQRPYILMRTVLDQVNRDIVYSICQYGWGDVWKWGAEVGGNSWRTTGDIRDTWDSMGRIGFQQADLAEYAKPGHWNDPDMMVLGKVGWGPNLRDSQLTPDEQYTHMSLWCLLCSPLLLGCPIDQLDEFTMSLLTNDEVLDVSQDPLGQQARRLVQDGDKEIWAKLMEDGSMAIGLFNKYDYAEQEVTLNFSDLNIDGKCVVRDLWRQKDLGTFSGQFTATVPVHGVKLLRIIKK